MRVLRTYVKRIIWETWSRTKIVLDQVYQTWHLYGGWWHWVTLAYQFTYCKGYLHQRLLYHSEANNKVKLKKNKGI